DWDASIGGSLRRWHRRLARFPRPLPRYNQPVPTDPRGTERRLLEAELFGDLLTPAPPRPAEPLVTDDMLWEVVDPPAAPPPPRVAELAPLLAVAWTVLAAEGIDDDLAPPFPQPLPGERFDDGPGSRSRRGAGRDHRRRWTAVLLAGLGVTVGLGATLALLHSGSG